MSQLTNLPEITDHVLSGLRADDQMKQKILLSATQKTARNTISRRTFIAMCSLSLLLILLCIMVTLIPIEKKTSDIQNIPAGSYKKTAPVPIQNVINEAFESDAFSDEKP